MSPVSRARQQAVFSDFRHGITNLPWHGIRLAGSQIVRHPFRQNFYCAATAAAGMSALASPDDEISWAPVCFKKSLARAIFSDVSQ